MDGPLQIAALIFASLWTGMAKAGFGVGVGIVVTPLLSLFLPARKVVGLLLPLLIATDIYVLRAYWKRWSLRNVGALLPGMVVGIGLGWLLFGVLSDLALKRAIGILACLFAPLHLLQKRLTRGDEAITPPFWLGLPVGAFGGMASTLAHVGGVVTAMYLLPQGLPDAIFVGTCTVLYFFANMAKLVPYLSMRIITLEMLKFELPFFLLLLPGAALGMWLNRRLSGQTFQLVVLGVIVATGIKLTFLP